MLARALAAFFSPHAVTRQLLGCACVTAPQRTQHEPAMTMKHGNTVRMHAVIIAQRPGSKQHWTQMDDSCD